VSADGVLQIFAIPSTLKGLSATYFLKLALYHKVRKRKQKTKKEKKKLKRKIKKK
jgi:Fe-S cluster assembly ATPase SufC